MILGIGDTAEHLSQWAEGSGGSASVQPEAASLATGPLSSLERAPADGRIANDRAGASASGQIHLASLKPVRSQRSASENALAPALQGQALTRVIDYTYDPLNRLVEASYSTGELFQYTYDAVGSTLAYSRTLAGLTTDAAYTYNAAYQLLTAQESGGPLWNYTYDGNGQLVEASPDGDPTGARHYGYGAAGYLTQVEAHDGTAFQLQAEMTYNGLGDRLSLITYGCTTCKPRNASKRLKSLSL